MNQIRLFKLKHELLKISTDLQIAFAADTRLSEGQWLKEQLNVVKLRMFRVGTRRPTVSRTEGQYLVPVKTFIKKQCIEVTTPNNNNNNNNNNVKLSLCLISSALCHEDIWGSGGIAPPFLTSASCPCRFTPGERAPGTHWIGGWVGSRAGLE
jgi:hypothetical protein